MKMNAAVFHQSKHLDAHQLEPPGDKCPFCNSTSRQPLCVLQNEPDVFLLECAECHAASASRMPTADALEAYYDRYYQSPMFSDADNRTTFDAPSRFGKYLATLYLQQHNHSDVKILDFGGGDGSVSHAIALELLKRGVDKVGISVVDYNKDALVPKDDRISIFSKAKLSDVSEQHRFVVASAIIEHLPEPRPMLDACFNLLEPGGVFYARTPCMVPIMRLCHRVGIELDLTYPAHVHDLGQQFWESYFSRGNSAGIFRILKSKPSIVESTFKKRLLKTVAAYSLKAPWYVLGQRYKLVGGWEVFVKKNC